MEKQIKQLVELSKMYYELSLKLRLEDGEHNFFRGNIKSYSHLATYPFTVQSNDDKEISVYLNDDRKTWAVNFAEIEYAGYSDKITFPAETTLQELQEVYEDGLSFIQSLKETV